MQKNDTKLSDTGEKFLYSFDIFDTLITRTTATPIGIFLIAKQKIEETKELENISPFLKDNFAEIRKEAESYSGANQLSLYGKFDCTFDDIYELIGQTYNLNDNETNIIKKIEIETELHNIAPIWKNIERVKSLISENQEVILISDMYYSESTIRYFLTNIDSVFNDIKIFTSSDTAKRKSNGSLYRYIQSKYDYKKQIHTGDNEFSDFIQAKWNNIKPIMYNNAKLKPYEKLLLEKCHDNCYFELSIGTSRLIRENTEKKSRAFEFGVSFAAPILYSYVNWILEQTKSRQIKHLYFISRDGYIPKIIADILIEIKKSDIKTHYFYSSRRASRFPDEKNITSYIRQVLTELENYITPQMIAERFNISTDELRNYIAFKNKDSVISQKRLVKLNEILSKNELFKSKVIENNKLKKQLFAKYLKQEIDFSQNDFAFVDINGSGRTQDNLAHIVSNFCPFPIRTFYLHLQSNKTENNNSIKIAYINTVNYISLIPELLCRTATGQTVGYEEIGGKIEPVCEQVNSSLFEKWGYYDYLEGIKEYTRLFSKNTSVNNFTSNDIDIFIEYIKYIKTSIDKESAEILGSIPFCLYGDEKKIGESAPKYSLFNIFTNKTLFKNISIERTTFPLNKIMKVLKILFTKTNYGYISKEKDIAYIKIFKYKFDIRRLIWKELTNQKTIQKNNIP